MRPGQDDMGGHVADDMGIVVDAGGAGISRPSVGLGGDTGSEIGFEKSVQAANRVIGHLFEADTAGAVGLQPTGSTRGATILDLDRADDEDLALMAAPPPPVSGTSSLYVPSRSRPSRHHK